MNNSQYPDSMFNMRAAFYDRTKKQSRARRAKEAKEVKEEPENVRKLRDNVKLHQRPLTTNPNHS